MSVPRVLPVRQLWPTPESLAVVERLFASVSLAYSNVRSTALLGVFGWISFMPKARSDRGGAGDGLGCCRRTRVYYWDVDYVEVLGRVDVTPDKPFGTVCLSVTGPFWPRHEAFALSSR